MHSASKRSRNVSLRLKTAEDLINKLILPELKVGRGFVPLIGSGFSAPSGLPIIWEMHSYLQECIGLALGLSSRGWGGRPWNPRRDKWPPFNQMKSEPDWLKMVIRSMRRQEKELKLLKKKESETEGTTKSNFSAQIFHKKHQRGIFQEAIGAMAEWRSALLFLSRLVITTDEESSLPKREIVGSRSSSRTKLFHLSLSNPEQTVIDACFDEALAGKDPMIGHRMLGMLSVALRLDIVLTTNFDDLLERAFIEARNPLSVSAVQLGTFLPPHPNRSGERLLIKMHGDRNSLRADYSLDGAPSREDLDNFVSYFATPAGRAVIQQHRSEGNALPLKIPFEKNLLILGHSLSEPRTVELIRYACTHLGSKDGLTEMDTFKVISICFSQKDLDAFHNIEAKYPVCEGKFYCIRYEHSGLFFLRLFQSLRRALPSWGAIFPSTSRLALPPMPDAKASVRAIAAEMKNLKIALARSKNQSPWKRLIISASRNIHGATSVCTDLFDELKGDGVTLWIDMTHIGSTMDLFEKLLDSFHYQSGRENWKPTKVGFNDVEEAAEMLALEINRSRKQWTVFINARERPGANFSPSDDKTANGWLDATASKVINKNKDFKDKTATRDAFIQFWSSASKYLDQTGRRNPLLRLCILCVEDSNLLSHFHDAWGNESHFYRVRKSAFLSAIPKKNNEVVKIKAWAANSPVKQRFVYALLSMQRPRYPAVIWSEAFRNTQSKEPYKPERWLNVLEKFGVLARKPGGFIWVRSRIRKQLLADGVFQIGDSYDVHQHFVSWYKRALAATKAPSAVLEAVYHAIEAARMSYFDERYQETVRSINLAENLLKTNAFLIQTQGYAFANFRILHHYRTKTDLFPSGHKTPAESKDNILLAGANKALEDFKICCAEIARSIARELGEYNIAYAMHRECASLLHKLVRNGKRHAGGTRQLMSEVCFADKAKPDVTKWVRWWRWSLMLGVASRSFSCIQSIASHCTAEDDLDSGSDSAISVSEVIKWIRTKESAINAPHELSEFKGEALRLIEQILTARMETLRVAKRNRSWLDLACRIDDDLTSAMAFAVNVNSMASGRTNLNWCLARIYIHKSAFAVLQAENELDESLQTERWRQAMSCLNDANSYLQFSYSDREEFDRAVVELYRADAKLRNAHQILSKMGNSTRVGTKQSETIMSASALISEGHYYLIRAEKVLARRRRNVWWSTWYFERMLNTIAMSVQVAKLTGASFDSIPFFGVEVLSGGKNSFADELLQDSLRMIRVDSYRLATILETYLSILKHLGNRHWQLLEPCKKRMRRLLKASLITLKKVHAARNLLPPVEAKSPNSPALPRPETIELDSHANKYVHKIIRMVNDY